MNLQETRRFQCRQMLQGLESSYWCDFVHHSCALEEILKCQKNKIRYILGFAILPKNVTILFVGCIDQPYPEIETSLQDIPDLGI